MELVSRSERWWFNCSHVVALAVGVLVSYVALEHNPQGEFCAYVNVGAFANYSAQGQPCLISWADIGWVFFPWLIAASIVFFYAPFILWRLARMLCQLGGRNRKAAL